MKFKVGDCVRIGSVEYPEGLKGIVIRNGLFSTNIYEIRVFRNVKDKNYYRLASNMKLIK